MNIHKKRSLFLLLVLSFSMLSLLIWFVPPQNFVILGFSIHAFFLFLPLVSLFLFSLTIFLSKSLFHAALFVSFCVISLTFLFFDLRAPLFFVLLAAFCLVIEIIVYLNKKV